MPREADWAYAAPTKPHPKPSMKAQFIATLMKNITIVTQAAGFITFCDCIAYSSRKGVGTNTSTSLLTAGCDHQHITDS